MSTSQHPVPAGKERFAFVPLLSAFLLYLPAFLIWFVGDDIPHFRRAMSSVTRWEIFRVPGSYTLRPFERFINGLDYLLFKSMPPFLSHGVALAGFLIAIVLVMRLARVLMPGLKYYPLIAGLMFAVLPVNVMAVINMDTLSQIYSGVACLFLVLWLLKEGAPDQLSRKYGIAGAVMLFGLLNKETGVGLICATPFIVSGFLLMAPSSFRERSRKQILRRLMILTGVLAVALGIYFLIRQYAGTDNSQAQHSLLISPWMTLMHILQYLFSCFYMGSSLELFPELKPAHFGISVLLSAGMFILLLCGLRNLNKDGWKSMILLCGLFFASLFPAILIQNTSELYVFGFSPFFALAAGLCGAQALESYPRLFGRTRFFLLAVVIWLATGTFLKVQSALRVSDQTKQFVTEIARFSGSIGEKEISLCLPPSGTAAEKPEQSRKYFHDTLFPRRKRGEFSVFVKLPENVLQDAVLLFNLLYPKKIILDTPAAPVLDCDAYAFFEAGSIRIEKKGGAG